jgi:hypothetical protein
MAAQFPEAGLDASQVSVPEPFPGSPSPSLPCLNGPLLCLQWYDSIAAPVPVVDEGTAVLGEGATAEAVEAADPPLDSLVMESMEHEVIHEDSARKLRVRHKRAADSAFKARRSARLAAKEAPTFLTMLSKAKAAKASKFDLSGGSSRFRAAAEAAGFGGSSDPGPIPVQRLRELAAVCGVDPDAVDDVSEVPPLSA